MEPPEVKLFVQKEKAPPDWKRPDNHKKHIQKKKVNKDYSTMRRRKK
jgi:hypothetical protein